MTTCDCGTIKCQVIVKNAHHSVLKHKVCLQMFGLVQPSLSYNTNKAESLHN